MPDLPDDLRFSPHVSRRLFLEADEGYGWAVAQKTNGDIKTACNAPPGNRPHIFQQDFAYSLLKKLNSQIPNGGSWTVSWCDGWRKLVILWLDKDGDIQFPVEDEELISDILNAGPDHFVGQCAEAWQLWKGCMDVLELKPEETYKRAQGERRPTFQ